MRKQLIDGGYPNLLLDSTIKRAQQIPRKVALRHGNREKKTKGPIFAHTYDPRPPPMAQIQAWHLRTMVHKNSYLAEVFTRQQLTAQRRQPNIRNYIIRAKLPRNEAQVAKWLERWKCFNSWRNDRLGIHVQPNARKHSLSDLTITVIEQSKRKNNLYRKEREEYHKNCFNTFYKGLNKKKKQWCGLALYCVHNCKSIEIVCNNNLGNQVVYSI